MTMREILFRGKHVLDGRWIEGFYNGVRPDLATMQTKECHRIFSLKSLAYDVVPDTIGQFTGLTDKHGKKIFEGDIVKFSLITGCALVPQGLRQVTFNGGSFMIEDPYSGDDETISRIAASIELEVVGNIYDNPGMIADYIQSVRQELMEDK